MMRARLALFVMLMLLGHSFGLSYLESRAQRAQLNGLYVSALRADDRYAAVEWDDFVYYPRAIAVADRWPAIDPWMYHEGVMRTWGIIPPVGATAFGGLLAVTGDADVALYIATIVSTVAIGLMLAFLFEQAPAGLGPFSAGLAAVLVLKMPWMAVKTQQLLPLSQFFHDTVSPFVLGQPLDALTTVEAGLFTYAFYVAFIALLWRAAVKETLAAYVAAGVAAGALIYVYYYHYIFAFALLAAWMLAAVVRRDWRAARYSAHAIAAGLACTIPHFINLAQASRYFSVSAYVSRLGVEPGRFSVANVQYLPALAVPLLVGWCCRRYLRPSRAKDLMAHMLAALIVAYFGVLSVHLVLGFDIQSDHYWRQSLGVPATIWMVIAVVQLARAGSSGAVGRRRLVLSRAILAGIALFGIVVVNASWISGRAGESQPTCEQRVLAERIALVSRMARPGDVVMTTDIPMIYHAVTNVRVRPFVPFVQALTSQDDILRRFFVAEHLTGGVAGRVPTGAPLPNRDKTAPVRSERKYLTGTDEAIDAGVMQRAERAAAEAISTRASLPRVDLILAGESQADAARQRIASFFAIDAEAAAGGMRAFKVRPAGAAVP